MPRNQLLGQVDADTRQWIDGVLTICSLQVTSESLSKTLLIDLFKIYSIVNF